MSYYDQLVNDLCQQLTLTKEDIRNSPNFRFRTQFRDSLVEAGVELEKAVNIASQMEVSISVELSPESFNKLIETYTNLAVIISELCDEGGLYFSQIFRDISVKLG